MNQRDTMLLLLAIATIISLKKKKKLSSVWLLRKTRKGVMALKEKITFLSGTENKRNRKRKSWGCCSKGVRGIEES